MFNALKDFRSGLRSSWNREDISSKGIRKTVLVKLSDHQLLIGILMPWPLYNRCCTYKDVTNAIILFVDETTDFTITIMFDKHRNRISMELWLVDWILLLDFLWRNLQYWKYYMRTQLACSFYLKFLERSTLMHHSNIFSWVLNL